MSIAGRIRESWSPIPRPSAHPTGAEVWGGPYPQYICRGWHFCDPINLWALWSYTGDFQFSFSFFTLKNNKTVAWSQFCQSPSKFLYDITGWPHGTDEKHYSKVLCRATWGWKSGCVIPKTMKIMKWWTDCCNMIHFYNELRQLI